MSTREAIFFPQLRNFPKSPKLFLEKLNQGLTICTSFGAKLYDPARKLTKNGAKGDAIPFWII